MNRRRLASLLTGPLHRQGFLRRTAAIWLGLIVSVGSAIPPATPKPIPLFPEVHTVFAGDPCSSHTGEWTTFTGHLSNSSGTLLTQSTTGDVYGRISNVDRTWQLSPGCGWWRYDAVLWATSNDTSHLTVDWGLLDGNEPGEPCIYFLNSSDYLHANEGACPAATTARLVVTLPEGSYTNDVALDNTGNFAFAHSDCDADYGAEPIKTGATTSTTSGKPGNNCGYKQADATGTTQTLVVDHTAPTISFTFPAAGGPAVVPSAFAGVTFSATDALAGFDATHGWTLQRQVATWSGSACGAFANDGSATTGFSPGSQVVSQSLALGKCYRWTLTATDKNGNTASTITSGSIRTDTSGVLGLQRQLRIESWDLGAGDSLSVSVGSDNAVIQHPIFSLPIRGSSVSLGLTYNSQDASNVGFGPGWRLNVQRRLALNGDGTVTFSDADGSRHTFTSPVTVGTVTTYTRPSTLYATIVKDTSIGANEFVLTYRDEAKDKFDILGSEGILVRAEDRFANGVNLNYVAGTNRISSITDTAASPNRTIDFAYDGSNRLTSITDWAYLSGGVVQTGATGSRRVNRFFYDGSSNLVGWADPLDSSDSCPAATVASHVACLAYSAGLLTSLTRNLTTIRNDLGVLIALPQDHGQINTTIAYAGADVASVTDATGAVTSFSHPGTGQTKVVRPATPANSETTYSMIIATDALGRVSSVKRKLGGSQIEQLTAFDTAYPIEPASITENNGALLSTPARTTSYTYVASSLGLLSVLAEPLVASPAVSRTTTYSYDSNNDVTQKVVARSPSDPQQPPMTTRYCYDASCGTNPASPTLSMSKQIDNYVDGVAGNGTAPNEQDVTTAFQYDAYGQQTRSTRSNYNLAGTLLDSAATGSTYDDKGNQTSTIANYADGTVANGGDDVTPNATTNARTDLTTAFTFDTAGNQVSVADPRRAIETAKGTTLAADDFISRATFNPLNEQLAGVTPTTPGFTGAQRTETWTYNELGGQIEHLDYGAVYTATSTDNVGRPVTEFEDPDGNGPATDRVLATRSYDGSSRVLWSKTSTQVSDSNLGKTASTYDELGRETDTTEASGSTPVDLSSKTHRTFDALDRQLTETVGSDDPTAQTTTTTYDLGGRATAVDDEFTCTTTAYDFRDLATSTVQGLTTGTCASGTPVTTTITNDGLGRVTLRSVDANNAPESNTYDAAGNWLATSGKQGGVTTTSTYTFNPLDQVIVETRTDGSTTKSNYDAAGSVTDRCYWKPGITLGSCLPAGSTPWTNAPTQAGTSAYDAQNQRISLTSKLGASSTVATTTYDPANNYQIAAFYLPIHYNTDNPPKRDAEAQDLYEYDTRHRLWHLTHQRCAVTPGTDACTGTVTATGYTAYAYDDNDNRTQVVESSTAGQPAATTYNYCYDALNWLRAEKTTAGCTTSSGDETYTYDDGGNRKTSTVAGSTRNFNYGTDGQLDSCTTPTCTVTYYDDGRTKSLTDNGVSWFFVYDADGKLISACKATSCSGSIDRVDFLYDGSGHRTQIKDTTSAGAVTTTDLRYEGDTIVQESVGGTVTRTYAADDNGRIVEVCDADCATGTVYVVVYNGHGDATGLWRQDAAGTLTLANSYTYTPWGTATTTIASGFSDLKFRFLYVGASDVQWDGSFGLNLLYMHARHYSPGLGRFLQPDPSAIEANPYAYSGNSPVTKTDPTGLRELAIEGGGAIIFIGGFSLSALLAYSYRQFVVALLNVMPKRSSLPYNPHTTCVGRGCAYWRKPAPDYRGVTIYNLVRALSPAELGYGSSGGGNRPPICRKLPWRACVAVLAVVTGGFGAPFFLGENSGDRDRR